MDKDTAERLYEAFYMKVFSYVMTLAQNQDDAMEITQETFYQAIRSIDRFDGSCKVSTWLCAIAKNLYLGYLRKNPAHEDVTETEIAVDSTESIVMGAEGQLDLLKKLHDLPEPYREVMYLRIFGGLSFAETAEVLGKSENWARVTFYRGKEKLRKEMEDNE